MAAYWAVFLFWNSGPAITARDSLDLKQEIQQTTVKEHSCLKPSLFSCLEDSLRSVRNVPKHGGLLFLFDPGLDEL
jgi:hypothetical protein